MGQINFKTVILKGFGVVDFLNWMKKQLCNWQINLFKTVSDGVVLLQCWHIYLGAILLARNK